MPLVADSEGVDYEIAIVLAKQGAVLSIVAIFPALGTPQVVVYSFALEVFVAHFVALKAYLLSAHVFVMLAEAVEAARTLLLQRAAFCHVL